MSTEREINANENEDVCVVCCKGTDIYAVGICDHPVCYECSTRMRVLCKQNECPICRQDMPKVIFTDRKDLFANFNDEMNMLRANLQDKAMGLLFTSTAIQKAYYALLEHKCPVCRDRKDKRSTVFRNFNELKEHVRKEHELFYCELCVANLKIFTSERRCYTRQERAMHRRKGDPDNKSHRGHPLCEFCDTRYMDNDELFRHLRRDHFYCHFCDADGYHQYYNSYEDLRVHFLQDHFLCEEGNCRTEQFTSVFRTQIDLKAHQASVHSRDLGKTGTKQARTVEVAFTLTPRPGITQSRRQNRAERNRQQDDDEGAVGYNNFYTEPGGNIPRDQQKMVDPMDVAEFPQLGGTSEHTMQTRPTSTVTFTRFTSKPLSGEDFPTLGNTVHSSSRPSNVTITAHSKVLQKGMPEVVAARATHKNQPNFAMHPDNFPSLSGNAAMTHSAVVSGPSSGNSTVRLSISSNTPNTRMLHPRSNVSIQINNLPMSSTIQVRPKGNDFPVLGKCSAPAVPQWVQSKPKKHNQQQKQNNGPMHKVNPAPALPPSSLTDFPVLPKGNGDVGGKTKKRSSVTVPVLNSWVNLNSFNSENRSGVQQNNAVATGSADEADGESSRSEKYERREKKGKKDHNHQKSKFQTDPKKKHDKNDRIREKRKGDNEDSDGNIAEDVGKKGEGAENSRNGIVKKLSELKISSLASVNENSNRRPDGTSLATSDQKRAASNSAPPGFSVKPPPGFDTMPLNINNLLLPSNDLTFTNSSGQSFPILPARTANVYKPPSNFDRRNESLIRNFAEVIRDTAAIMEFKNFSALFRQGKYPAEKYYRLCSEVMGSCFDRLFPELLVLLPDISKQQDLYKEHLRLTNGTAKNLEVCLTCSQVLAPRDLSSHMLTHSLQNNFPVLPQQEALPNHWKK